MRTAWRVLSEALRTIFSGSVPQALLPVLLGRYPQLLFENSAEIQGIVITHNGSDFGHGIIGLFQQNLSIGNPEGQNVQIGRASCRERV